MNRKSRLISVTLRSKGQNRLGVRSIQSPRGALLLGGLGLLIGIVEKGVAALVMVEKARHLPRFAYRSLLYLSSRVPLQVKELAIGGIC